MDTSMRFHRASPWPRRSPGETLEKDNSVSVVREAAADGGRLDVQVQPLIQAQ